MPTPTERFALDTYDPGESWDHTDTVQFLDEIAVARDTVANRPTSGTYDGEIFFATDEEIFYQWDETNTQWNEVLNAPTQAEFDSHSTRHESGGADEIPLNNLDLPAGAQIDEDGGDLVIRDSGGSIVLRRDEGAGTWDFVSGDLTGIASLEAGSIKYTNLSQNTTHRLLEASVDETFDNAGYYASKSVQFTTDVSTTAKTIIEPIEFGGSLIIVSGREEDAVNGFTDILAHIPDTPPVVIGSNERNSPATRSYSGSVELSMSEGVYNVTSVEVGGAETGS